MDDQVFKRSRILFLILALSFLFFFDDFFVILLVEQLDLFPLNSWIYRIVLVFSYILSICFAYAVYKVMRKLPTTGREGMRGKIGEVIAKNGQDYQVFVNGEIWSGASESALRPGDRIVVQFVDGLVLRVKPL